MVSTKFIKQTKQLELTMTQMGQDCLKGLSFCKHALYDRDKTLIQEINELHEDVSANGRECEQICMRILLLQHPVAKDLRKITVATNTVRDMTRIMDQEKEVADLVCRIQDTDVEIDGTIHDLFSIAKEMISGAISAYMQKDEDIAHEVIKLDDKADSLYIDTKELYIEKLAAKTGNAETLVDLLLVGKYLERICDHAVNIAKWVLFQKKGVYEE